MRILELFSGTGSVGNVCRRMGLRGDVFGSGHACGHPHGHPGLDYSSYLPNSFDVIWASPPCTEYSVAKTVGVCKLDEANTIVKRTVEIIRYFNPR